MKNLLRLVSGIMMGIGLILLIVPSQVDYVWNLNVGLIPIFDDTRVTLALLGVLLLTIFAMVVLMRKIVERRHVNE